MLPVPAGLGGAGWERQIVREREGDGPLLFGVGRDYMTAVLSAWNETGEALKPWVSKVMPNFEEIVKGFTHDGSLSKQAQARFRKVLGVLAWVALTWTTALSLSKHVGHIRRLLYDLASDLTTGLCQDGGHSILPMSREKIAHLHIYMVDVTNTCCVAYVCSAASTR